MRTRSASSAATSVIPSPTSSPNQNAVLQCRSCHLEPLVPSLSERPVDQYYGQQASGFYQDLPARADTPAIGRQYSRAVGRRASVRWNLIPGRICTPDPIVSPEPRPETLPRRLRRLLVGSPRDLRDRRLFHRL